MFREDNRHDSAPERACLPVLAQAADDARAFRYAGAFARAPMAAAIAVVKCPQCGAAVSWSPESKWRPFCSERCKTIDLGAWASERYRVKTAEAPESGDPSVDPDTV